VIAMSSWFEVTPENESMLSEERLILACTELVYEAMDGAGVETKQQLAELLGVSKNEVGQRLSGRRNLTIKTLAAMLHSLGSEAQVSLRPITPASETGQSFQLRQPMTGTTGAYTSAPLRIAETVTELSDTGCVA